MDEKRKGLEHDEVIRSRMQYGTNLLTQKESESFLSKMLGNFGDPIIRILVVALIIDVIIAIIRHQGWYESIGIAAAVLIATFVSTLSEHSNESTFQKLQEQSSKIVCKVFRDGSITEVQIEDIVVGDLVVLQAGDKVPADGKLLEGELKIDQSALNGETAEAKKVVMPEDFDDTDENIDFFNQYKLFRGSVVCSGEALLQVTSVGDRTVYGKIAQDIQGEDRDSPLKIKLGKLANAISIFGYTGGIGIALAYMFQKVFINNSFNMSRVASYFTTDWKIPTNDFVNALILAVVIIVVAVPEGLPMMIAMVLSLNMRKMLRNNVLVRKLVGIETSGSLNILFTDKTGTITKGQLEVVTFIDGENNEYDNIDSLEDGLGGLVNVSILQNTNALYTKEGGNVKIFGGNSTEHAVLQFAANNTKYNFKNTKIFSVPFSSENKYSATQLRGDHNLTFIKGAPEKLIDKCTKYYNKDGTSAPLSKEGMQKLETTIDKLAKKMIRVLVLAASEKPLTENMDFSDLTLVGVIGIRDEIRKESVEAIGHVLNAGIQVVMITGDRKETASAIASEIGLLSNKDDLVLTSDELKKLSDKKLKEVLPHIRVLARALPSDKSRLVETAQSMNLVVGMTGDGVNDAPALKKADVGFAMGSGTEIAKEAGDIVILDDNFLSISKAVLYGRTIFKSIRKFVIFQLSINVCAVFIAFIGPLLGFETPLSVTQMLWVNLVMDTLAALAFGGEPALEEYMNERPKRRDESVINGYMWSEILTSGVVISTICLIYLLNPYFKTLFRPSASGIYFYSGFFALFIFSSIVNGFNTRTSSMNLFKKIGSNTGFLKVMGSIAVVQILLIYFGGAVFRTEGLNFKEWVVVILLSLIIIPFDLIRKLILKSVNKQNFKSV
jgi:calcium-translocating P-type ATPase